MLWPTDGKVVYEIDGDNSKFEKSVNATQVIADKAFGLVGNVGKAAMDTIAAAAAAVTAAVGKLLTDTITVGSQFDSSMSQVAATMGFATEDLNDETSEAAQTFKTLRDAALSFGATTAFSANEASEALNYMALAGYDAETAVKMLPNVLNLAAAGAMDLGAASDMITDSQTALGLTLDETNTLVDQMAKTASKSNTSVSQLGDAILTVGGNARYMHGGTEELTTVLGLLADNGIKGSEAGTHLRNMLLSLAGPSKAGAAAIEQIGLKVFDAEGKMRSFEDIFSDLKDAFNYQPDDYKLQMLGAIFNTRDMAAANALMETSVERWGELTGAILDSTDAAKNMAEVQLDNLSGDVTLFKSALEGAEITLSDALTPKLRAFVQKGTEWVGELNNAFNENGLEGLISKVGTITGEVLTMLIDMAPELTSTVMSIINGILSTILVNQDQVLEAGAALLESLVSGMREVLPTLGELIRSFAPLIVETVLSYKETIFELGLTLLTAFISGIGDHAEELVALVVDLLTRMGETIIECFPLILSAIAKILPEVLKGLASYAPQFLQVWIDLLLSLADGIDEITEGLVAVLPDVILELVRAIVAAAPQMAAAGYKLFTSILMNIGAIVEALLKALWEVLKALFNRCKSFGAQFRQIGDDWIAGLWEGIKATFTKIKDKVVGLFDGLVGGVKKFLGISSPSKVFKVIGQYVDEGLADGIAGFGDLPEGSMTQVVRRVIDSGTGLADLAGQYNLGALAPDPSFNIANQLTGTVEMDGFKVGTIVLRNLDDAAAFSVRGV